MILVSGPTASQDAARAFEEGADLVQLREKEVDDRTYLHRAREIVQIAHQRQKLCLINDRPDIALLSQADGCHLGQHDLPLREVRSLLGPRSLLGISVHNTSELEKALLEFPDYLGVGTLFSSSTRPDLIPSGPEFLLEVSRTTSIPHFAIGGIDKDNLATLQDQGIHGVAISQAAHQTPQIRQILDAWSS
jgi:thiamine-phosphate pyrophosphorylase